MLTDDLAATGEHRAAVPAGQADAPVLVPGVTRYVVRFHRRAECGVNVTVVGHDPDFTLPTAFALCLHVDLPSRGLLTSTGVSMVSVVSQQSHHCASVIAV